MKKIFTVLVALAFAAGVFAQGITLAQGKPEIDTAFKAYAAAWSEANNIPVPVTSLGGS
jgi:hypothetical protein